MKTIWKYKLDIVSKQAISIPKGAKFLHVGDQLGNLTLWAVVDPKAKEENKTIFIVGTGHDMPKEEVKYIGSHVGSIFVWHVFMEKGK